MVSKYRDCSLNRDEFDSKQEERLGAHIYFLVDPRGNKPFYIGKAGGSGQGNNRLLSHFDEARKKDPVGLTDEKIKKIHEIWDREEEVDWCVFRCEKADDAGDAALQVETALIQFHVFFRPGELTNKQEKSQRGMRLLSKSDVLALGAEELEPEQFPEKFLNTPIMLFNISKGYEERGNYKEALVRAWKLDSKYRRLEGAIAIGLVEGISHIAIRIKEWKPWEEEIPNNRYEIIPDDKNPDSLKFLEHKNCYSILKNHKNVWDFWRSGAAGASVIFKIHEDQSNKTGAKKRYIEFLRGLSKKTEVKKRSDVDG